MFIGHFAVGFAAKRLTPQVSLGAWVAAPLFLDLLWPAFLAAGIETVRIDPGNTRVTPFDLHDYPYSHSLVMAIVWAVVFGAVIGHLFKSVKVAVVGGALVFSHWLLDFVTHRPDMPLYPGSETYVGLGLWNSLAGTLVVELGMFAAGVAIYATATRANNKRGRLGFWSFVAALLAFYFAAIFGPPPPDVQSIIGGGFAMFALVAWAYWADKNRTPLVAAPLVALALLAMSQTAHAQVGNAPVAAPASPVKSILARLTIRADQPAATINRNIYGSFAEHLGRGIYEGIWVGEGSPIPNTRGIRKDVIAALKALDLPLLRWPGGCFADEYHWRDGIGPRAQRPRRANTSWGGIETNAFGLHEFMDLAGLIGAEPYISVNVGSGTPQEMMDWLEYMTSDSDSQLAQLRRKNGRKEPWKVTYVGVGNENWGCGGNMRPEYYADEYKRFVAFIKKYSGHEFMKIACGASDEDYAWTEVLMKEATKHIDGLSLHYYTLPTSNWKVKGSATQFGEPEWHATLMRTLRMTEFLNKHSAIMDKYDPEKRVALVVDEWGTWYDPEPGTPSSPLYQQNTLRDAIVAGINLNLFNQHADRVQMAASAQAINVLQALILTDKAKLVLTPTYHVFEMYKVHQGATSLPVELDAPRYALGKGSVPSLHASASRDAKGVLHLTIVNLQPVRGADVALKVTGASGRKVTGRTLTAPTITSLNTFDAPPSVQPAPLAGIRQEPDRVVVHLPSKSVTVLDIE